MRRRDFIAGLGAAAWPIVARAQQPAMPVVGFLQAQTPATAAPLIAAFRQGLAERGFVEGRNLAIEYRLANGQLDLAPALAADLVARRVNVLASGFATTRAAKSATGTIPIVFMGGADPVRAGLVASINRPGGNITGVSLISPDLMSKRIGLLHELVPQASVLGAIIHAPDLLLQLEQVQEAARRLDLSVRALNVTSQRDFDDAFATLVRERAGAVIVTASTLFNSYPDQLVAAATRHSLPTAYELREFVVAGGLMSYAPSINEAFRQGGIYTARVLNGEKPADLPVLLPAKFEFALNLKTAKALGVSVPAGVLALADEVIE
jgi:putative ABC transport system substrate-binding protein